MFYSISRLFLRWRVFDQSSVDEPQGLADHQTEVERTLNVVMNE